MTLTSLRVDVGGTDDTQMLAKIINTYAPWGAQDLLALGGGSLPADRVFEAVRRWAQATINQAQHTSGIHCSVDWCRLHGPTEADGIIPPSCWPKLLEPIGALARHTTVRVEWVGSSPGAVAGILACEVGLELAVCPLADVILRFDSELVPF